MRPNTVSGGSFTTPKHSPDRTMTFKRTLVNRPKNPFQSPGTQSFISGSPEHQRTRRSGERVDDGRGRPHPSEDSALGLDHRQPHLLKYGKVRTDAILDDQTVVTPIVRFADRR